MYSECNKYFDISREEKFSLVAGTMTLSFVKITKDIPGFQPFTSLLFF